MKPCFILLFAFSGFLLAEGFTRVFYNEAYTFDDEDAYVGRHKRSAGKSVGKKRLAAASGSGSGCGEGSGSGEGSGDCQNKKTISRAKDFSGDGVAWDDTEERSGSDDGSAEGSGIKSEGSGLKSERGGSESEGSGLKSERRGSKSETLCWKPVAPRNGTLKRIKGNSWRVGCKKGYRLSPSHPRLFCRSNGTLNRQPPICVKK